MAQIEQSSRSGSKLTSTAFSVGPRFHLRTRTFTISRPSSSACPDKKIEGKFVLAFANPTGRVLSTLE
jgi:hypothetical protein